MKDVDDDFSICYIQYIKCLSTVCLIFFCMFVTSNEGYEYVTRINTNIQKTSLRKGFVFIKGESPSFIFINLHFDISYSLYHIGKRILKIILRTKYLFHCNIILLIWFIYYGLLWYGLSSLGNINCKSVQYIVNVLLVSCRKWFCGYFEKWFFPEILLEHRFQRKFDEN